MNKRTFPFLVTVLLSLLALACGEIPAVPPLPGEAPTAAPTSPSDSAGKGGQPAGAQVLVDLSIADLAAQVKVSPKAVEVVRVEEVRWPDGCLGCPQPGQACTDVIVPGYRIILRVAGADFEYRTDQEKRTMLCLNEAPQQDWGEAQPVVDAAVADLAGRLKIAKEQIQVLQVLEKEWNDSSLGCPQPGQAYLTVITPGYQIILEAGGKRYDYRSGRQAHIILCEQATQ